MLRGGLQAPPVAVARKAILEYCCSRRDKGLGSSLLAWARACSSVFVQLEEVVKLAFSPPGDAITRSATSPCSGELPVC